MKISDSPSPGGPSSVGPVGRSSRLECRRVEMRLFSRATCQLVRWIIGFAKHAVTHFAKLLSRIYAFWIYYILLLRWEVGKWQDALNVKVLVLIAASIVFVLWSQQCASKSASRLGMHRILQERGPGSRLLNISPIFLSVCYRQGLQRRLQRNSFCAGLFGTWEAWEDLLLPFYACSRGLTCYLFFDPLFTGRNACCVSGAIGFTWWNVLFVKICVIILGERV